MSLPNYLAKIKSSGVYRFVWDKSALPPQTAETLRLVVGYSEKGPFNTPVYVESVEDFISIYGNISKRLERKGVYFHRMAEQALAAGPILALNIKPFDKESVDYISFNPGEMSTIIATNSIKVSELYDTNRFWVLDADKIPGKVNSPSYITVAATDTKENSCTLFMRPTKPDSYKGITIREWYNTQSLEIPDYLIPIQDTNIDNYFMDIYVFRGEFTKELCSGNGPLKDYFIVDGEDITINSNYTNIFDEKADALEYLSKDSKSNFITSYTGCTIPYFKDANGNYISIDIKFNSDNSKHNMLMKLNEEYLEGDEINIEDVLIGENALIDDITDYICNPIYITGYEYNTIKKSTTAKGIQDEVFKMFKTKGIRTALTNRVDVEYHYIIDTFDTLLRDNHKAVLSSIAKEKENAFAILNFPKVSVFNNGDYKNSTMIDFKKVVENGGFTVPGDSEGASYCAYYTQLIFSDGSLKTVVPSAAIVSNNFMEKWNSRQPYYIVAGPIYGSISYSGMIGPDYNFGRSDLDVLEPYGVNAIIYVPRKGTYINSNQTAKQRPVSALSKIHVRELVIYLQNEVEALLQSYQWELNTQALRDTIKAKADAILDTIMNNGGVYAYKNVCDHTNNTPEVIDNEMIILDTEIEPARGAGKMVHQLTIHKTGGLTSNVK